MTVKWRPAKCLLTLRGEVDAAFPNRDRGSDGIIGDARHQHENHSDHNPDANGVVHAIDIDSDGIAADYIAGRLVMLGRGGDPRLAGGYVIWNRRIASAAHGWVWRPYTGKDPHTGHIHVSVTKSGDCDLTIPWVLFPENPPKKGETFMLVLWQPVGVQGTDPHVGAQFLERGHQMVALDKDMKQQLANSTTNGKPEMLLVLQVEPKVWKQMTNNYQWVVG